MRSNSYSDLVDFHCHVLPGIDDGSKNVEMSLGLLKMQKEQGISTVCATPHFYASRRSVQEFLERRNNAYDRLCERLPEDAPRILLGAEVLYFSGISKSEDVPKLCLEGTDVLLLEMPTVKFSNYMLDEIIDLSYSRNLTVVMAHIERYFNYADKDVWDYLRRNDILMQSNAGFFIPFGTKRKAAKMLRDGLIQFVGTDCHNLDSRSPDMDDAVKNIVKYAGEDTLRRLIRRSHRIIGDEE